MTDTTTYKQRAEAAFLTLWRRGEARSWGRTNLGDNSGTVFVTFPARPAKHFRGHQEAALYLEAMLEMMAEEMSVG